MKSVFFLAALCVVAARAQYMDAPFEEKMERTNEIVQKCTKGSTLSPDVLQNFWNAVLHVNPEQASLITDCVMSEIGMMDESGAMQFDRICQWVTVHLPEIAEPMCAYSQTCTDEASNEQENKGNKFIQCMSEKVIRASVKGMQMPI